MRHLENDKFMQCLMDLTASQLEFILTVWKDRICIWNPNTREQYDVDDVWINGTAIELGIRKEPQIKPGEKQVDLDEIKLK